jgi:chromosomal replication initiation ATPase DnaA
LEQIARWVADHSEVLYEDMLADTRKRAVSKARAIVAVLATRNGASAAATAQFFNRSRSALIEQVEHYRIHQPEIFIETEQWLDALLAERAADPHE